jgi:hypothetical protein
MSVTGVLGAFAAIGPESENGSADAGHRRSYAAVARNAAMVGAPIALAAVAVATARRKSAEQATNAPVVAGVGALAARATGKAAASKARRYRPKNIVRYYGLGVVISTLERDSTRKALIATLKWIQKRS